MERYMRDVERRAAAKQAKADAAELPTAKDFERFDRDNARHATGVNVDCGYCGGRGTLFPVAEEQGRIYMTCDACGEETIR